eukprot:3037393-Amphidinium_carterae.1
MATFRPASCEGGSSQDERQLRLVGSVLCVGEDAARNAPSSRLCSPPRRSHTYIFTKKITLQF